MDMIYLLFSPTSHNAHVFELQFNQSTLISTNIGLIICYFLFRRSMITELNTEARTAEAECEKKDDRIKSLEELVEALRQQTASSAQNNSSVHDVSSTTATDDFLKLQSEYLELVEEFDKLSSDHRLLQIEHQNAEEGRLSAEKDSMEHYNALEGMEF